MIEPPGHVDVPKPLLRASRGVAACGHPLAAGAAVGVLERGGNAVDAAVAAAFCLSVLLPDACGLGGDALFTVRAPDGTAMSWNGSGAAPAGLSAPIPADGAATAAVPGAARAWEDGHRAGGRMPWADLVQPAISLAENGIPCSSALLGAVHRHRPRLERGAAGWEFLDPALAPGQRVAQPALARLLRAVAAEGADAVYQGAIAEAIEHAVAAEGGSLSTGDLSEHRTVVCPPSETTYAGARLWAQPPVSQALLAPMALAGLERSGAVGAADRTHTLVEAMTAAFAYRDLFAGSVDVDRVMDIHLEIDPERALHRLGPVLPSHTTGIATADAEGQIVSMLISVFDNFGCATLVPPGGFLLNDRMIGFSTDPDSLAAAAPGRRPVHTLSPMVVGHAGTTFALATPGADGQVQMLAQLIAEIVDNGTPPEQALCLPRWRSADGRLHLERGFSPALRSDLERRGHVIVDEPAGAGAFGAAVVAGVDHAHGTLFAAADPRREAWAAGC